MSWIHVWRGSGGQASKGCEDPVLRSDLLRDGLASQRPLEEGMLRQLLQDRPAEPYTCPPQARPGLASQAQWGGCSVSLLTEHCRVSRGHWILSALREHCFAHRCFRSPLCGGSDRVWDDIYEFTSLGYEIFRVQVSEILFLWELEWMFPLFPTPTSWNLIKDHR